MCTSRSASMKLRYSFLCWTCFTDPKVHPTLECYHCHIWNGKKKKILQLLDTIQRRAEQSCSNRTITISCLLTCNYQLYACSAGAILNMFRTTVNQILTLQCPITILQEAHHNTHVASDCLANSFTPPQT